MRPVFILYESRSGSTFLAAELAKYNKVYVTPEIHFVSKILEYPSEQIDSHKVLNDILFLLYTERHFLDLGIEESVLRNRLLDLAFPFSKKILIERITSTIFSRESFNDDEIVVIKHSPNKYIGVIEAIFPEVCFIQMVRDPRAIYCSQKKSIATIGMPMSRNPVRTALRWNRFLAITKDSTRCIQVRYEDLILSKECVLKEITSFLHFSTDNLQRSQFDYKSTIGKSQVHLHTNVSDKPLRDRVESWKTELRSFEKWIIQYITRCGLNALNYENEKDAYTFVNLLTMPVYLFSYLYFDFIMYARVYGRYLLFNRRLLWYKIARKFGI